MAYLMWFEHGLVTLINSLSVVCIRTCRVLFSEINMLVLDSNERFHIRELICPFNIILSDLFCTAAFRTYLAISTCIQDRKYSMCG